MDRRYSCTVLNDIYHVFGTIRVYLRDNKLNPAEVFKYDKKLRRHYIYIDSNLISTSSLTHLINKASSISGMSISPSMFGGFRLYYEPTLFIQDIFAVYSNVKFEIHDSILL